MDSHNPAETTQDVTVETICQLERLAYLRLSDEDRGSFVNDLRKILGYARSLASLDLKDFAPQTHAIDQDNVMRGDVIEPSSSVEEALANAPVVAGSFLQVPRVLE
ncbi:MAG: Asp-tRNA(Asn)/Glu-tRNA(Gln) amidotransferase subunit GatC [Planctomycetaceae bacterium]|nr:Asp-tRNA(Asn)/Glu-tRNA(Gln) amidotransferase subunit GatC [Planctomycetaceae bacterium]